MITSIKKKFYLQYTLFLLLSLINKMLWHRQNRILLYINLEFRDNLKAIFDYMVENGYNEKYEIVCASLDYRKYENVNIKNVRFVSKIRGIRYFFSAGFVFYCIGKYPILPGKKQKVIQMWHGAPFKAPDEGMMRLHSKYFLYYTTVLSTSKHFVPTWCHHFSFPADKIFIGGYPRCDALFTDSPDYDFGRYKKLIVWAPTFRKSKWTGLDEMGVVDNILPVLQNNELEAFDAYLKEKDVKIVVKLHPMQDLEGISHYELTNLILLSHQEFTEKGFDFYRFMVQTDALITDYSSIFVDYLLLDRPIAFTEDDLEKYGSSRGFSSENPNQYKCGARIKNKEDLMSFVDDLTKGKDVFMDERNRVNDLVNDFRNGGYSKRLLDSVGVTI